MTRSIAIASVAALTVFLTVAPASLSAQGVTVDEGEFRVLIAGTAVGSETFSIEKAAGGVEEQMVARGVVEIELDTGAETLQQFRRLLGANLDVSVYQVIYTADEITNVVVNFDGPRFVATTRSAEGSREKEYRAEPGVLFLENRVAHQYYFLARAIAEGRRFVPAILALEGRRVELSIQVAEGESIVIAGRTLAARRITLGSGALERRVWLDTQGRVLRVEIPAQRYEAIRTAPPT